MTHAFVGHMRSWGHIFSFSIWLHAFVGFAEHAFVGSPNGGVRGYGVRGVHGVRGVTSRGSWGHILTSRGSWGHMTSRGSWGHIFSFSIWPRAFVTAALTFRSQ